MTRNAAYWTEHLRARRFDTAAARDVSASAAKRTDRVSEPPSAPPLGLKRPGNVTDHSPISSAKVRNGWRRTSTPSTRLHGVYGENFTFKIPDASCD
jgi:hypothetical protein